jgi:CRISPR-associated protein Cas1
MSTIYIITQGAVVRKSSKRFEVTKDKDVLISIPDFKVSELLIYGNVSVTTQAVRFAMQNGINIIFMNKAGGFVGKMTPAESKNIFLRLRQFDYFRNPESQLLLAKKFIEAKIRNGIVMLKRFVKNTSNRLEQLKELEIILRKIDSVADIKALRGFEGEASAVYFKEMRNLLSNCVKFEGRSYYPAKDQFNGLLNFLYGLLSREVLSIIESKGFDPYLGFYHSVEYGRVSLVFDVMEPFRAPVADSISVKLFRKSEIDVNDDFEIDKAHGYILKEGLRKLALSNYEEKMDASFNYGGKATNLRKLLVNSVESLESFINQKGNLKICYLEK